MSDLKSEIEKFLLDNKFELVNDVISSENVFVYLNNVTKSDQVTLSCEPNKYSILVDLENNIDDKRYCYAERFIINTIDDFIFLITHSTRSLLCREDLLI